MPGTVLQRDLNSPDLEWRLLSTRPGEIADPGGLPPADQPVWSEARVPGTAASALREQGAWSWEQPRDFDAEDWWFCTELELEDTDLSGRLCFEGLATLCEIWLDERLMARNDNMFSAVELSLVDLSPGSHRLCLCFRSLNEALGQKRPRPAWKTRLVDHQNLRWFRTTLLGRIPGWSPPVRPVGPWRPVRLLSSLHPRNLQLRPEWNREQARLFITFELAEHPGEVSASVDVDGQRIELTAEKRGEVMSFEADVVLKDLQPWMPHTHGQPRLYPATLSLHTEDGEYRLELPRLGFRSIERDENAPPGDFAIKVNGIPVFCRGACWTVNDPVSLDGDLTELRSALQRMRDAGCNMIRIGGTMIYEQDAFYALCDELGILVWQDFMFANMDYPVDDDSFLASVREEARQQLTRLSFHACLAVYCGNSEVEQQAAMLGLPPERAGNDWFHRELPGLCERIHPRIPYVPSTPHDRDAGQLPFRSHRGLSHYYGIGAYLRPLAQLRGHDVRFTPECLGLAHVPSLSMRKRLFNNETAIPHHPLWKQRTPRDANAGWDFEDVRDHYLEQLLSLDPQRLRYEQTEYYWRVSEFITGEILRRVFAEWRSGYSHCRGALIWFLKDLWPGAGWGILDSDGMPKLAWYALKRAWQPRGLCLTDENINGLEAHLFNESVESLSGVLSVRVFSEQGVRLLESQREVVVEARGRISLKLEEIIGHFFDLTYSYRFGPLSHQLVMVEFTGEQGECFREHYFPESRIPCRQPPDVLKAELRIEEQRILLRLQADRLLFGVQIEGRGLLADDQGFHLAPGEIRETRLESLAGELPSRVSVTVNALNLSESLSLRLKP